MQKRRQQEREQQEQQKQQQREREQQQEDQEIGPKPDGLQFLAKWVDIEVPFDASRSSEDLYLLVRQMLFHRFGDGATEWLYPKDWMSHFEETIGSMMDFNCEFTRFNLGVLCPNRREVTLIEKDLLMVRLGLFLNRWLKKFLQP